MRPDLTALTRPQTAPASTSWMPRVLRRVIGGGDPARDDRIRPMTPEELRDEADWLNHPRGWRRVR